MGDTGADPVGIPYHIRWRTPDEAVIEVTGQAVATVAVRLDGPPEVTILTRPGTTGEKAQLFRSLLRALEEHRQGRPAGAPTHPPAADEPEAVLRSVEVVALFGGAIPAALERYAVLMAREWASVRFLAGYRGRYRAEWEAGLRRQRAELADIEQRLGLLPDTRRAGPRPEPPAWSPGAGTEEPPGLSL